MKLDLAHVRVADTIEWAYLPLSYQPEWLTHVHLEEEMYSQDMRTSLVSRQICFFNPTLHEAESTHWALTCQCLLENGVGSETSVPTGPQISVDSEGSRHPEVSQFQCQSV